MTRRIGADPGKKSTVEIAPAADRHIPEIVEIWKEFIDYHRGIDPFFTRREDGHVNFERFVRGLIGSDDSQVLVAMDDGSVVAYSIARIGEYPPAYTREVHGLICDMAVKSGYRRQGIGERMLKQMLAWFESRNLKRIELHVVARNTTGYSFWKKHGFKDYMHILYVDR
jgi:ribosomal protein S18 acetylase RimI-like enzyme